MKVLLSGTSYRAHTVILVTIICALGGAWYFASHATAPLLVAGDFPHEGPASSTSINLIPHKAATSTPPIESVLYHYIEITNGCGPYYATGTCVNMRSGPGTEYPVVGHLRTGVVLRVEGTTTEANGKEWYKIIFDKGLRWPDRVTGDWYVAVDPAAVMPLVDVGDETLTPDTPPTTKRIVVDLTKEMLYAYDGDTLFMQEPVSTGLEFTPTPAGTFTIFYKTPSRYMQGPVPGVSDQYYDLPGVPWDLYFTHGGAVIHGAYWHNHFGQEWSHGCVNLPPDKAQQLYEWAPVGTTVIIHK
ncbi:MAG: L,D-transpeptidase family protein [Patescibacteria group bacterium]|nr:L,D-transpeptidase family protein [Patescibacteria group bacterium]